MRVFVSYRRSDDHYLASAVSDRLLACSTSVSVFLDVDSIGLGADFKEVILKRIADSDIVVVLIGPRWDARRLGEPADFVRLELLAAREQGKRIVPVLHSGARQLSVTELPPEMTWLPYVNTFEFGSPRQLEDDVRRLYGRITNRVPALRELREKVGDLYDRHLDVELMAVVDEAWREHSASPSPALAECCRLAAVAIARSPKGFDLRDLWFARAMSVAFQAGAPNAFAASLLPFYFRLLSQGHTSAAREVLFEMGRLMQIEDPSQLPSKEIMLRIIHEKLAYSYFVDGDFERALSEYEDAYRLVDPDVDLRGKLKIRGATALCLASLGHQSKALEILEEVRSATEHHGFPDVATTSELNLAAIRSGAGPMKPYEVT